MKKFSLVILLAVLAAGCIFDTREPKDSAQKEIVSDHAQLEEAKAIARTLMEGLEKVKQNEISRKDFESSSRALQKQLNKLILSLEDQELRELENYRRHLMTKSTEKNRPNAGAEM